MIVAARGFPDSARSSTPCRTVLKLPDASSASGSPARAASGQKSPERSSRTSRRGMQDLWKKEGAAGRNGRPFLAIRRLGLLAGGARAGLHVERTAFQGRPPVADKILRVGNIGRPFLSHDEAGCLGDDVELTIRLDFTDQHRLGDV